MEVTQQILLRVQVQKMGYLLHSTDLFHLNSGEQRASGIHSHAAQPRIRIEARRQN